MYPIDYYTIYIILIHIKTIYQHLYLRNPVNLIPSINSTNKYAKERDSTILPTLPPSLPLEPKPFLSKILGKRPWSRAIITSAGRLATSAGDVYFHNVISLRHLGVDFLFCGGWPSSGCHAQRASTQGDERRGEMEIGGRQEEISSPKYREREREGVESARRVFCW